jgi:predicted acetyltransferase
MREALKEITKKDIQYKIQKVDTFSAAETENFLKLFYECFGQRPQIDKAWYNWFCNQNPYGVCSNYAITEKSDAAFIGMYCLSKAQYVFDSKTYLCGIGVNGMVNSNYRNQGLYAEVIAAAMQNDDTEGIFLTYLHGANIGTIKGHYATGWTTLKKVFFYSTNQLHVNEVESNIREIYAFSDIKNVEKMLVPKGYNAYNKRTAKWFDWRFFSRPHKKYNVLASFNAADELQGYIILGYYRGSISRCQILDYNAETNAVLTALINATKQLAQKQECSIVDLWLDDYSLEMETFKRNDFTKTEEYYEVLTTSRTNFNIDIKLKTVLADLDAV